MQPQGGLLIAAILVLAIATGCRRDDEPGTAHGGPPRQAAPAAPEGFAMREPSDGPPATEQAPTSQPSLGRATNELDEIGREAIQLRGALLHANFRSFDQTDGAAEADEQATREVETAKEADNDSR